MISSSTCMANCAPPCSCWRPARRVRIGFDRPRASVWRARRELSAKRANRRGKARARAAGSPTRTIFRCHARYSRGRSLSRRRSDAGPGRRPGRFLFPIPQAASASVDALLRGHGIADEQSRAIAPGTIWETKHWGSGKFAEVARHFMRKDFAVAARRAAPRAHVCEEVARLAPGAVNLAGETTLTELAALIRRSTISVTNDSGPDASGGGARTGRWSSVFGPTDRSGSGHIGGLRGIAAGVPCSPCFLRQLSRCRTAMSAWKTFQRAR